MKNILDLLQSILSLVFFALGSAAFLKYLLWPSSRPAGPHRASGKRTRASRGAGIPAEEPTAPAADCLPPDPVNTAAPTASQQPKVHKQPTQSPAPIYPRNPPHDPPAFVYEIANPGLKRSEGFPLQLQPSSCGILLACRIHGAICVYVQPGLEDDSADLKRQCLSQIYELYDPAGVPLQALPRGFLRITNIQPALCAEYGANLTLLAKGRVSVAPADTSV